MPYTYTEAIALDRLPGMTDWESELCKTWLELAGQGWDAYDFNVRLGEGVDPGPGFPESIRQGSIANTQPRADCIAYRGAAAAIVEVKVTAYLGVLGQILAYEHLLKAGRPDLLRVDRIVVAHAYQSNVAEILAANNVKIFAFPQVQPSGTR
jgi:hypothetical protein